MSSSSSAGPSCADDRVYRAVAAGGSLEEVRRAIERSRSSVAVNQAGANGETPLRAAMRLWRCDLLCLLLESSAEGAGDGDWFYAVCWCVDKNDLAGLQRLIERGVCFDTANAVDSTPLMRACYMSRRTANRRDLTLEILRRSSAEMRRAVANAGRSAVDYFVTGDHVLPSQPWHGELISELLAAGAPVRPDNAVRAVPIAAAHAARREAELAACQFMAHDWRAQETFAGLSMDMGEMREAEQMVAARRARLAVLELALSSGTDSDSGGSESGSGSGSEEGEATGSGNGGECELKNRASKMTLE